MNIFRSSILAFFLLAVNCIPAFCSEPVNISSGGKSSVDIIVPVNPESYEQTAADDLLYYLNKITGAEFSLISEPNNYSDKPAIFVGSTRFAQNHCSDFNSLSQEQWIIRSFGRSLVLTGGGCRGTLYAVYHFLEDELGVHWWTPFDEYVPNNPDLSIDPIDQKGKPVFSYRNMIYPGGGDNEDIFSVRNRINTHSVDYIPLKFGGDEDFGPPWMAHSFHHYVPESLFDRHPEWFSLVNGKRTKGKKSSQLCVSNMQLRNHIEKKLREYIRKNRKQAREKGFLPAKVYDLSHNDGGNSKMCQCPECSKIRAKYGSDSGLMLDFINDIAQRIEKDYPDIRLSMLAYNEAITPPTAIKPRGNVVVTYCMQNRYETLPLCHPLNDYSRQLLEGWAKISPHLRVWEYSSNHAKAIGSTFPTVHNYQRDMQYLAKLNIEGILAQHFYELMDDMRDLKVWLWAKLTENPFQDNNKLLTTFTDGYYGPAGKYVRAYLEKLQEAAKVYPASAMVQMQEPLMVEYLNIPFLINASDIFDKAEQSVKNDKELLERVQYARLTLDYSTLKRFPISARRWQEDGSSLDNFPFNKKKIADRYWQTITTITEKRNPSRPPTTYWRKETYIPRLKKELDEMINAPALPVIESPARFKAYKDKGMFDMTAYDLKILFDVAKVVNDSQAESGITCRAEFSHKQMEKYKLPIDFGVYDWMNMKVVHSGKISASDIKGKGYNWYKLGRVEVTPVIGIYLFWSWYVQAPLGLAYNENRGLCPYDIFASIKFEGSAYLGNKASSNKNAVCIERIIAIPSR